MDKRTQWTGCLACLHHACWAFGTSPAYPNGYPSSSWANASWKWPTCMGTSSNCVQQPTGATRFLLIHITSPEANIPDDFLRSMQDGIHGLSSRECRWICSYISNFSILKLVDIDELLTLFEVPWDPSKEIRSFKHYKQHTLRLLAANFCPMKNHDVYIRTKTWFNSAHWSQCWNDHARTQATLATLNVDHLFADIIMFCDTSLPHMTTAQADYHASAAAVIQASPTNAEHAFAAMMAVYESKRQPASKWKYYCHTHGPNHNPDQTSALC